jgi:NDP-sugar pyrophosphorylase family protein
VKAVLMSGGEGQRLRPVTATRPKPFVPVGDRPCIEYVIESLKRAGVKDVVLTTCYRPEALLGHLGGGERLGVRLFYSVEEKPLGTAGGVRKVASLLDDTFIVASGDVFADVDIEALIEFHRRHGGLATMALTRVDDPSQFGVVDVDGKGQIRRFQEKPKREEAFSNLVNAGIYVLEPEVLAYVPEGEPFDFAKHLFPLLLKKGEEIFAMELDGLWIDIGRPRDLIQATAILAERAGGALLNEDADVAATAQVESSAVYSGARVGEGALVRRSIVLGGAEVGDRAFLDGTIDRKSVV